jgi:hypothetical protein
VKQSWKGPANGELLMLQVVGDADDQTVEFAFAFALSDATRHHWPPAEFLRRDRRVYVNDGCLTPLPPASLEQGVASLERLLPIPKKFASPAGCVPIPPLSCSKLDQTVLEAAAAKLAHHYRDMEHRLATSPDDEPGLQHALGTDKGAARPRAHTVRDGSCAGCTISRTASPLAFAACVVALCVSAGRRRLRRRFDDDERAATDHDRPVMAYHR